MNPWVVSSMRVDECGPHDHVEIWNRGGKAGYLIVNKGDGEALVRMLMWMADCDETFELNGRRTWRAREPHK